MAGDLAGGPPFLALWPVFPAGLPEFFSPGAWRPVFRARAQVLSRSLDDRPACPSKKQNFASLCLDSVGHVVLRADPQVRTTA